MNGLSRPASERCCHVLGALLPAKMYYDVVKAGHLIGQTLGQDRAMFSWSR